MNLRSRNSRGTSKPSISLSIAGLSQVASLRTYPKRKRAQSSPRDIWGPVMEVTPKQIDYINAHGTSTPLGDEIELGAVKKLFGEHAYKLSMSSTKSAIGHLLGAAGSVEAIYSILAIRDDVAPPTLNLDNPSEGCDIDLVPHQAKQRPIKAVMTNSFGFGGTNATLVFTAYS